MSDPREYQLRGRERLAPDRGSAAEEADYLDGYLGHDCDDDYLEQSPETGYFPHDA